MLLLYAVLTASALRERVARRRQQIITQEEGFRRSEGNKCIEELQRGVAQSRFSPKAQVTTRNHPTQDQLQIVSGGRRQRQLWLLRINLVRQRFYGIRKSLCTDGGE